ncbi:MAG: hypothetical protein V7L11_17450 [Nostoc sp.]
MAGKMPTPQKLCLIYLVPSLRLGMLIVEAPPLLLAAEPPGATFPA